MSNINMLVCTWAGVPRFHLIVHFVTWVGYNITFDIQLKLCPTVIPACTAQGDIGMVSLMNDDDDVPQLSAETFSALSEFYKEQEDREKKQEEVRCLIEGGEDIDWKEDWQLSQFWYTEDTAARLAEAVTRSVGAGARVACVSAPTLYRAAIRDNNSNDTSWELFEYDKRFAAYGDKFHFYDYKAPLDINRDLREKFDLVFADPPFLSDECLTKTMVTVKFLTKDGGKIVLCTGAVMAGLANRLANLNVCKFEPSHKNSLSNPFQCFANFDFDEFLEENAKDK